MMKEVLLNLATLGHYGRSVTESALANYSRKVSSDNVDLQIENAHLKDSVEAHSRALAVAVAENHECLERELRTITVDNQVRITKLLDTHTQSVDTQDMATQTLPRSIRLLQPISRRVNETNINDRTQQRFLRFHANNPHVYVKLVELARKVKAAGKETYSIWALYNRLRWHMEIETESKESFKLSNDFTSRYSRLIMQQEPDLKGFFVTRPLRCATPGK